jgi:hypothetical protein
MLFQSGVAVKNEVFRFFERDRETRTDGVVVHRVSKSKTLKQYLFQIESRRRKLEGERN